MKEALTEFFHYFVDTGAPTDTLLVKVGIGVSLGLLVLGVLIPVWLMRVQRNGRITQKHEVLARLSVLLRIAGSVWFILFFLRYQNIPYFTFRLWIYLLLIPVIVYGVILGRQYRQVLPTVKQDDILQEKYRRYLPQAKKQRT